MPKTIRCYDYVNRPYEQVCESLVSDSNSVFRDATLSAESRAENVAAGLHVKIAGFDVAKNIRIAVRSRTEIETQAGRKMTLLLHWQAAENAGLFPSMNAQLDLYPLSSTETQLDFYGEYEPPLGLMGKAIDAIIGHRIAEASVHQFVQEVAFYLRENIPSNPDQERV